MRTVWSGVVLIALAIPLSVLPGGLLPTTALTALGWVVLFAVVNRRRHEAPKLVLGVLGAGFLCLAAPLTVHDAVIGAAGEEVVCPVESVVYHPSSGSSRSGSGSRNRWTVDCPGLGPVTFDAAVSAIDSRATGVPLLVDPVGLVAPRPKALLISPWFVLIPALGWVGVAGVVRAIRADRRA